MVDDNAVQAAVVLQLLGRVAAYPRANLTVALATYAEDRIRAALDSLAAAGIVRFDGESVSATDALTRLDQLGLIAV
ncbi:MAG TPA: hypothetical protein VN804_02940 [Solirubrobacteraceae bacterium]|nr:hypothetical protein [Solirubrobacteraceae bacterium]